ncbi:uncharacterized protein B0H18DRAFT_972108 [Fomitopsis serialis]|uniref:uncharacterized protein n=1 Tax=Fomitopsis serialis TaxID=139415 RepID=UPI002008CA7A|nr:uncharacterized protein B0H18DRAFT_972108 [Neoantrodia serialis]KAH9936089.1 hypothetical protein B0H18DRAFT_972108 [Neoantrodia serialis]
MDSDSRDGFMTPTDSRMERLDFRRSASPSSRKRARLDDELDDCEVAKELHNPRWSDPVRDETYYFADGSCILRVEDTLFNVHRTMLSRDSSMFSTMFALPVPSAGDGAEGSCDENPVYLAGDTITEFRNFLWALYALPHELLAVHSNPSDFPRLLDVAKLSNKYSFRSVESWALDAVNDLVVREQPNIGLPALIPYDLSRAPHVTFTPTGQLFSRLIRLAQACGHDALLNTMSNLLRKRMRQVIDYAYLAMSLADELDLRKLRGAAYMEILQRGSLFPSFSPAPSPAPANALGQTKEEPSVEEEQIRHNELLMSPEQKLRLLSGYYRLTAAWESMRRHPLSFDHAPTCGATWHQHGCSQSWLEFWKEKTRCEAVLDVGMADVPGRLKAVGKELDRWGSATYMHHDCRQLARKKIDQKAKEIEALLPDYFI